MLPEYFEFSLPTKLVYGIGILGNLGEALKPFGKRRAILVTDEILVKAGPVDKVKAGFKGTDIDIVCTFDKVSELFGQAGATLSDICAATVFVKRPEDVSVFREMAAARGLAPFPAVCVVTDICRAELLFEMDAEAVFKT